MQQKKSLVGKRTIFLTFFGLAWLLVAFEPVGAETTKFQILQKNCSTQSVPITENKCGMMYFNGYTYVLCNGAREICDGCGGCFACYDQCQNIITGYETKEVCQETDIFNGVQLHTYRYPWNTNWFMSGNPILSYNYAPKYLVLRDGKWVNLKDACWTVHPEEKVKFEVDKTGEWSGGAGSFWDTPAVYFKNEFKWGSVNGCNKKDDMGFVGWGNPPVQSRIDAPTIFKNPKTKIEANAGLNCTDGNTCIAGNSPGNFNLTGTAQATEAKQQYWFDEPIVPGWSYKGKSCLPALEYSGHGYQYGMANYAITNPSSGPLSMSEETYSVYTPVGKRDLKVVESTAKIPAWSSVKEIKISNPEDDPCYSNCYVTRTDPAGTGVAQINQNQPVTYQGKVVGTLKPLKYSWLCDKDDDGSLVNHVSSALIDSVTCKNYSVKDKTYEPKLIYEYLDENNEKKFKVCKNLGASVRVSPPSPPGPPNCEEDGYCNLECQEGQDPDCKCILTKTNPLYDIIKAGTVVDYKANIYPTNVTPKKYEWYCDNQNLTNPVSHQTSSREDTLSCSEYNILDRSYEPLVKFFYSENNIDRNGVCSNQGVRVTVDDCEADGICNLDCPYDPDCCADPSYYNSHSQCKETCEADGICNPNCPYDPDCCADPSYYNSHSQCVIAGGSCNLWKVTEGDEFDINYPIEFQVNINGGSDDWEVQYRCSEKDTFSTTDESKFQCSYTTSGTFTPSAQVVFKADGITVPVNCSNATSVKITAGYLSSCTCDIFLKDDKKNIWTKNIVLDKKDESFTAKIDTWGGNCNKNSVTWSTPNLTASKNSDSSYTAKINSNFITALIDASIGKKNNAGLVKCTGATVDVKQKVDIR